MINTNVNFQDIAASLFIPQNSYAATAVRNESIGRRKDGGSFEVDRDCQFPVFRDLMLNSLSGAQNTKQDNSFQDSLKKYDGNDSGNSERAARRGSNSNSHRTSVMTKDGNSFENTIERRTRKDKSNDSNTGAGATTINAASNTRRQYGLRAAGQQKPHTDTPVEEETMSTTVSEMLPIQTNEGPSGYDAKENDAIGAAGWQEAEQPAQNPDTFVEDGASEEVQVVNGAFAANTGIGSIPEQAENARETDAANAGNGAEAVAINTEESAEAKSGRNSYETAVLNTAAAKDKVGKDEMEQMIWDATGEEIEVKLDDYGEDIAVIREFMDSLNQEQKESVNHRDRDSGFVESSESGSGSGSKSVSEPESMAVEAALTDEAAYMRIQARKESIIENGKDAVETDDATGEAPEDGSIHMPSGFGDSGLGNADADGRAAVGNGMSAYDPGSDETGGAGQTGGNIVNSEGSYAVFETPATEVKVDFVDKSAQWRQAGAADQIDKAEFLKAFEKEARIILSGGKSEMVMQLKPESLGKLTLKIVTEHGVVNAKFIVESEQVKRELETNIQMLKETLTSQGMSVRECTVHVGVQDRYADGPVGGGSEGAKKRRAQSLSGGDVSVSANGIDSSRREILRSHYFFDESSIQFLA